MVKNLRLLREEKGISQQKLAELLGTTQQAVYKYEKTDVEPDIATLIRIADIFGVTVDFLIGNSDLRVNETAELSSREQICVDALSCLPDKLADSIVRLLSEMTDEYKK